MSFYFCFSLSPSTHLFFFCQYVGIYDSLFATLSVLYWNNYLKALSK